MTYRPINVWALWPFPVGVAVSAAVFGYVAVTDVQCAQVLAAVLSVMVIALVSYVFLLSRAIERILRK